jgi:hypothetical protein
MKVIFFTLFKQSAIGSSLKLGLLNTLGKVEVTLDCSLGNHAESDPAADSGLSKASSDNPANMPNTTLSLNGISPITAPVISSANTASSPDTRFSFPSKAPGQFRCLESCVSPHKILTSSRPLFFSSSGSQTGDSRAQQTVLVLAQEQCCAVEQNFVERAQAAATVHGRLSESFLANTSPSCRG